jgi:drug/metabolite transporter (DMT)-like permease
MDLLLWMITAVVAYLACGDALTIYHAIGAVVILSGIVLTQVSRRQANQRPMLTAEDAENS